jgi:hypothetical protein
LLTTPWNSSTRCSFLLSNWLHLMYKHRSITVISCKCFAVWAHRSLIWILFNNSNNLSAVCEIVHNRLFWCGSWPICLALAVEFRPRNNIHLASRIFLLIYIILNSALWFCSILSNTATLLPYLGFLWEKWPSPLHHLLLFNFESISLFARNESSFFKSWHIVWDFDWACSIHHHIRWRSWTNWILCW